MADRTYYSEDAKQQARKKQMFTMGVILAIGQHRHSDCNVVRAPIRRRHTRRTHERNERTSGQRA